MLFKDNKKPTEKKFFEKDFEKIKSKIYIDQNTLASEKMINIWEDIFKDGNTESSNWKKLKLVLKMKKFRDRIGRNLQKFFPSSFKRFKEDTKFSFIKKDDIVERIQILRNILKIEEKLECELISNRVILIKKS